MPERKEVALRPRTRPTGAASRGPRRSGPGEVDDAVARVARSRVVGGDHDDRVLSPLRRGRHHRAGGAQVDWAVGSSSSRSGASATARASRRCASPPDNARNGRSAVAESRRGRKNRGWRSLAAAPWPAPQPCEKGQDDVVQGGAPRHAVGVLEDPARHVVSPPAPRAADGVTQRARMLSRVASRARRSDTSATTSPSRSRSGPGDRSPVPANAWARPAHGLLGHRQSRLPVGGVSATRQGCSRRRT